ncbi:hypothetical protein PtB15_12B131 [Puccinia triticina]|nr:hypothetical protein PtB15_12B131 [Puccinia triticina]
MLREQKLRRFQLGSGIYRHPSTSPLAILVKVTAWCQHHGWVSEICHTRRIQRRSTVYTT